LTQILGQPCKFQVPAPAAAAAAGKWAEASALGLEGLAWPEQPSPRYGRLQPGASADVGADVYSLSQCSAGVVVFFETDAAEITVNITRRSLGAGHTSLSGRQDDIMPYNGKFSHGRLSH
jgi:hypothetical protein